ncbi:MAG: hypothetical protein CL843_04575 [Crocinitomicaceae bacterium]|nr:hypothetical protein [Crocinitomicaceae bacterium]|tara:strand:- start:11461 stop:12885 length:1425 start_codon:yes stop_codon:yes gene_type:complete
MSENNLDKILRDKLAEKQYEYKDEYWNAAKQYIDTQNNSKKNRSYFFFFLILPVAVISAGLAIYALSGKDTQSPQQITSQEEIKTNPKEKENLSTPTTSPQTTSHSFTTVNETATKEAIHAQNSQSSTHGGVETSTTTADAIATQNASQQNLAKNISPQIGSQRSITDKQSTITTINTMSPPLKTEQEIGACYLPGIDVMGTKLLTASMPEIKEIRLKNSKLPQPKKFGYGIYGEYYFNPKDIVMDELQLNAQQLWSAGAFAEYGINKHFSVQVGVGYQHQNFQLVKTYDEISEWTDSDVTDNSYWNYDSTLQWQYNFTFNNGVPTYMDSNLVQLLDSTYISQFDTTYINKSDTQNLRSTARYRLNWIEVPLKLRYQHHFGRWDAYGAIGIYANYLASISKSTSTENAASFPELSDFNRFTLDGSLQIGVAYFLTPHLRISIAPSVRMDILQRYAFIDNRSVRFGLTSGIIYRL